MWRVAVLSVETKLKRALEPVQGALELAKERVARDAALQSEQGERRVEEAIARVVDEAEQQAVRLQKDPLGVSPWDRPYPTSHQGCFL
jgi:hypothetical protein